MSDVVIRAFGLPKAGNSSSEFEDYFIPPNQAWNRFPTRLAVADGATESIFARLWAQIMVRHYCKGQLSAETMPAQLQRAQGVWRRLTDRIPLNWYAEEAKREKGAFTTLIGLELHGPDEDGVGRWEGLAVGDSCLFQVREESLVARFPIQRHDQFGSTPDLLASLFPLTDSRSVKTIIGRWQDGDRFLLMTDAIAAWFLRYWETTAPINLLPPIDELARCRDMLQRVTSITTEADFIDLVKAERSKMDLGGGSAMRNDDVTLMVVEPRATAAITNSAR